MTPKTEAEVFEYEWTGPYGAIMGDHSFEGSAVEVFPGENFKTDEPVNTLHVPLAEPVSPNAIAHALDLEKEAAETAEASETTEDSIGEAPAVPDSPKTPATPTTPPVVDPAKTDESTNKE